MGYSCGHKPYAGVCCVECRPDLFFNAAGFPTAYSPAPTLTPYAPDPRDARIAELEAEAARLEALIVEQGACGFVTDETYAEAAAIRSRL